MVKLGGYQSVSKVDAPNPTFIGVSESNTVADVAGAVYSR